jgi:hypothetical protein
VRPIGLRRMFRKSVVGSAEMCLVVMSVPSRKLMSVLCDFLLRLSVVKNSLR